MLTFTSFLLSAVKYGDYDAVLRCYTLEHGYQSFFFKNIYSSKSKKKAYLFPLNELEFTVPDFKSGKMPSISKVEWLNKNIDLQDQKLNSIRMFGAEFLDQVFRNENGSESIYAIISNFNERLCDKDYNAHLQLVFDVLKSNGLLPLYSEDKFLNPEAGIFQQELYHQNFDERISNLWKIYLKNSSSALPKTLRKERNLFLESLMLYYKIHFNNFRIPDSLDILKQVYE